MGPHTSEPRAKVFEKDGKLYLDDPDARMMIRAIAIVQCRDLLRLNAERVRAFLERLPDRGTPETIVGVVANVDDRLGAIIADLLMPGTDWEPIRARSEIPVARGLARRAGLQGVLEHLEPEGARALAALSGTAILVFDAEIAAVFTPEDVERA